MNQKNEILNAYNYRYACKEFNPEKKIADDDFNFILETGRLSPSSFGWEPWKFVVVQKDSLRDELKKFTWGAQRQLPSASHFVLLLARKSVDTKADSSYIRYMAEQVQQLPEDITEMKLNFFKNFQENDFDLTDDRKLFDWASKQLYIPMANMMSSAAQIGIDSCPIEGFNSKQIDAILVKEGIIDIEQFGIAAMVSFGYRAEGTRIPEKTRQTVDKVVEWIL